MRDQARAAGSMARRTGSDLQLLSAGGNGQTPLHPTPNALHSNISLSTGYDNSHSPRVPQRLGLIFREMLSNVTLSLKMKRTGYSK